VEHLGKSFRPAAVLVVPSLPKTRNGKILRRLARAAYLGLDPGDTSSLEDASTLDPIRKLGGAGSG
jgi:acetyl-CoA synthetase